jgi:hypothetical protein
MQSSSSKNHAGAIAGGVVGGLVACILVVVMVIYNKHRRMARLMTTQQFMLKKGLAIGKPVDRKDPVRVHCLNFVIQDILIIDLYRKCINAHNRLLPDRKRTHSD